MIRRVCWCVCVCWYVRLLTCLAKYLKTVEDRSLVPMHHQSEMTYQESNGHMTDDGMFGA